MTQTSLVRSSLKFGKMRKHICVLSLVELTKKKGTPKKATPGKKKSPPAKPMVSASSADSKPSSSRGIFWLSQLNKCLKIEDRQCSTLKIASEWHLVFRPSDAVGTALWSHVRVVVGDPWLDGGGVSPARGGVRPGIALSHDSITWLRDAWRLGALGLYADEAYLLRTDDTKANWTSNDQIFTGTEETEACTFGDVGDADPAMVERDNSFRQFRRLCADIAEENSYTEKTNLVATYLKKGNSGGMTALLVQLNWIGFWFSGSPTRDCERNSCFHGRHVFSCAEQIRI